MTLILQLPDDLEHVLSAEAQKLGLPLPEYALRLLSTAQASSPAIVRTGAELIAYWQREGVVGTRSDIINSQDHARSIRRRAETRGQD